MSKPSLLSSHFACASNWRGLAHCVSPYDSYKPANGLSIDNSVVLSHALVFNEASKEMNIFSAKKASNAFAYSLFVRMYSSTDRK